MQRPVVQDRLRIELALLATQWLGLAVLRPAGGPPHRSLSTDAR